MPAEAYSPAAQPQGPPVPRPPAPLVAERMLAAVIAWWGFILLLPHSTFADSRGYDSMANLAPESAWGAAMLLLGLIQMGGILAASRGIYRLRLRRAVLWTEIGFFAFAAAAIASGNPWAASWGWDLIFVFTAAWSLQRV